jgi:type II secretory pathway pseudopilin PulG
MNNLQFTIYNLRKIWKGIRRPYSPRLKTKNRKLKTSSGFTLVETLVAIFILMVAIVSPMSIASQALSSARFAKEQVTAFYLAQEGIELARNIRDNNVLSSGVWNEGTLGSSASGSETYCYASNGCMIEAKDLSVANCGATCDPLNIDATTGIYTYSTINTTPTAFVRTITIQKISDSSPPEIRISSEVSWTNNSVGGDRTFTVTDNLLNWQ